MIMGNPSARRGALTPIAASHLSNKRARRWQEDGLCSQIGVYDELFFPERGKGNLASARKGCQDCPVIADCLQFALDNDETSGLWGGTSPRERRRLKAQRNAVA